MEPRFSVVVPTHERRELLAEVLAALGSQKQPPPFEVVVVDDGSRDGTSAWLRSYRSALEVRTLTRPRAGPAAARNAGVAGARGEIVAFLGDDTIPDPDWLATHAASHPVDPPEELAVIGRIDWHARIRPTRFLHYINEQGPQFGFALIENPEDVPFNFLYTANVSLPRRLLLEEPFDEGFPDAAWEDIELAYRLVRRGMRIRYEPRARVRHDHPTGLWRFGRRQVRAGRSAVVFYERWPELGPFLGLGPEGPPPPDPLWRRLGRRLLAGLLAPFPLDTPGNWSRLLRDDYLSGLHEGWSAERAPRRSA